MKESSDSPQYLLVIRGTNWTSDLSPEAVVQNMDRFTAWVDRLIREGKFVNGQPLAFEGKIVKSSDRVTDGPFAESKEAIAGSITVKAANLESAVAIARGCPCLEYGQEIEVRPIADKAEELRLAARKQTPRAPHV
jgi:hypothetical protein